MRTFLAFAHAAIADAASLRARGTLAAALQSKSPERSFKARLSHKIQTALLPPALPMIQSRDQTDLGFRETKVRFILATIPTKRSCRKPT